jgi:hypothetical protein
MFRIIFSKKILRRHNNTIRCYDVLLFFCISKQFMFCTDEDGRAVENFCNTLFKCINYNLHEEMFCFNAYKYWYITSRPTKIKFPKFYTMPGLLQGSRWRAIRAKKSPCGCSLRFVLVPKEKWKSHCDFTKSLC